MPTELILANRYLTAGFAPETGVLTWLQPAGASGDSGDAANLIAFAGCRCYDRSLSSWAGEGSLASDKRTFEAVAPAEHDERRLRIVVRGSGVEVVKLFELDPDSPLLRVTTKVKALTDNELTIVGLPFVQFPPGFVDGFEDPEDLNFDGAELGKGKELPPWRVFFREGYETGLLMATRSRHEMSHLHVMSSGFRIEPHLTLCYSTLVTRAPIKGPPGKRWSAAFEIGPWTKAGHAGLLRAAGLNKPHDCNVPAARGKPARNLKGKMIRAVNAAPASAKSAQYNSRKWMVAAMPWAQGGKALFAPAGAKPPAIIFKPNLKGVYRVFAGVGNGAGITFRLSGDAESSYRLSPQEAKGERDHVGPFAPYLAGSHRSSEVSYRAVKMDGRTLRVEKFPSSNVATVLDYVRFEKLSPAQEKAFLAAQNKRPIIPLTGFSDTPDIAPLTDAQNPDPAAYRANIWEHANCKFERVYWRIDGQCSDYPSKINTMRYVSGKTHGVFTPQSKAYGRVLKKVDMLRMTVDAGKKYGVDVWGWMRFNNYTGNVQSDFYKKNPQLWEEWDDGYRGRKLCLALPEVRKHKIDILCEAAGYGLPGVVLGFLRHPPVLLFHPVIVETYKAKYGVLPPRDPKRKDSTFINSLPPGDEEHTRFYQHRADYLTLFGRELRTALEGKGLGHVKVSIWVRPNHCLFDGIDIPAWLNEKLCDEVVVDSISNYDLTDTPVYQIHPEWKKMVQAKVALVRGVAHARPGWLKKNLSKILADGYDGLCTYESDFSVIDSPYMEIYRGLCR